MKLAAIHCRIMPGGALEVFKDLIQQELRNDPKAEIKAFTMIAEEGTKFLEVQIPGTETLKNIPIVEALPSWISSIFKYFSRRKVPLFSSLFDYRNLIVFYPWIMKRLSRKVKKFGPKRIVISSFAIAKNIAYCHCEGSKGPKQSSEDIDCHASVPSARNDVYVKLYLHSPMQYIWSHRDEYLAKFSGRKKKLFSFLVPHLQTWDKKFTHFDEVQFNSKYTQSLAKKIYGIKGKVVYPKIKDSFYYAGVQPNPQPYFVCVGRLVTFVRECDVIIKAFNQLQLPLLMIGSGPDEAYLKSLAGDSIIFLGRLPSEETAKVVKDASALINLTKESFGIGTVEALLMGVPVIGYAGGATPELVDEESGILIEKKTIKNLVAAVEEFQGRTWERKQISESIRKKL